MHFGILTGWPQAASSDISGPQKILLGKSAELFIGGALGGRQKNGDEMPAVPTWRKRIRMHDPDALWRASGLGADHRARDALAVTQVLRQILQERLQRRRIRTGSRRSLRGIQRVEHILKAGVQTAQWSTSLRAVRCALAICGAIRGKLLQKILNFGRHIGAALAARTRDGSACVTIAVAVRPAATLSAAPALVQGGKQTLQECLHCRYRILAGAAIGSNEARYSGYDAQRRYDIAYEQCMYAKGNQLPQATSYQPAVIYVQPSALAPSYYPPPPPPGR